MDLTHVLQEKFNKQAFRPGQEETLRAALEGRNTLTIMPTGGGKSLIYQFLAAALNPQQGCVLVISPLVALIDDQYDQARALGLRAGKIHSSMPSGARQEFLKQIKNYNLLLMTPERLLQERTWEALAQTQVRYLVIDEAHCLSQWGHDFRPDYTRVPEFHARLGDPPMLALTATATARVKSEILHVLDQTTQRQWFEYQAPIYRPNLNLNVYQAYGESDKLRRLSYWAGNVEGPKIVYFSLVQTLERVSEQLQKLGVLHTKYHGQLPSPLKLKNQTNFFEERENLILATPAFGLGVNKSNIRVVLHYEIPQSIEAYFQEVGRAGRDGDTSWAEAFYDPDDVSIHMDFLKWNHPEPDFIYSLYQHIQDYPQRYVQEGADFLREKLNFYNKRDFRVETALNLLRRFDLLQEDRQGNVTTQNISELKKIPDMDLDLHQKRKKAAQMRLLDLVQLFEKYKSEADPPVGLEDMQQDIVDYFLETP